MGEQAERAFDYLYMLTQFQLHHGYTPNLLAPITFNEKLFHKMIFDRRPVLTVFTDKIAVREHVENRLGGTGHLTKVFRVFEKPEELCDFTFPERFVLKANHGSGWNYIHAGRKQADLRRLVQLSRAWMGSNYYYVEGEWCYKNIIPRVFCEEYLGTDHGVPVDYKFFCFAGKVRFIQVDFDRFTAHRRNLYDPDWNFIDVQYRYQNKKIDLEPPRNFTLMKSIAEKLSDGVDFVRVDLYDLGERVVFGEMTNFPEGGRGRFLPTGWDAKFGRFWL